MVDEILVYLRIGREAYDLLSSLPCDDIDAAVGALAQDIVGFKDGDDNFRTWFRGRWMAEDEESRLTQEKLGAEPLTAKRILEVLDPPLFRDWRPIQNYVEKHAKCADLAGATARNNASPEVASGIQEPGRMLGRPAERSDDEPGTLTVREAADGRRPLLTGLHPAW